MPLPAQRLDQDPTTRREVAVTRLWGSVHQLLEHRDDLVGAHPMADLIHDAVRWTA